MTPATALADTAGSRSDSWTPTYRLAHCEGYSVGSPAGRVGYVEEVVTTEGGPVALRIRTHDRGGRDVVVVPIDRVRELFASREHVVLGG